MRSLLVRSSLAGLLAAAVAGCGGGGTALPTGGAPNGTAGAPGGQGGGGGSNQAPPGGTAASILVVVPPATFTGYNVTGLTATTGPDPIAGLPEVPTEGSGPAPASPGSSALLSYPNNNQPFSIFAYTGTVPSLTYQTSIPGQIQPSNYGAIVFYAQFAASVTKLPSVSIELTGGSGSTTYDVRIGCATSGTANTNGFLRYVCDLPAYGAASGTYSTKYTAPTPPATVGKFAGGSLGPAIANPVLSNATGTFTPQASKLYLVLGNSAPAPVGTTNIFDIGYVYAEQGSQ